jgi:hypothetical protein
MPRLAIWLLMSTLLAMNVCLPPAQGATPKSAELKILRPDGSIERQPTPNTAAAPQATCALPPPALLTPADDASVDTLIPNHSWERMPETYEYRIEVASTSTFNSPITVHILTDPSRSGPVTFYDNDNLNPNSTYYWRVASVCEETNTRGVFSEVRSFVTGSGGTLLDPPALLSPSNQATVGSIRTSFGWAAVSNALRYQIRFYKSASAAASDDWFRSITGMTGTTSIATFDPETTIYWRMNTGTSYGWGSLSEIRSFTTPPVQASTQISPTSGGTLTPDPGNISVQFPPGAVSSPTTINYTLQSVPNQSLANFRFAGRAFTLTATDGSGQPISSFDQPLTITITYDPFDLLAAGIANPARLNLAFWDGSEWVSLLPCDGCAIDTTSNQITVVVDHFTEFALLAPIERKVTLPLVVR